MTTPVGPLATEAAQLLDVLAERLAALRDTRPAGDGAETARAAAGSGGVEEADQGPCPQCGHDPGASAACTGCPLCRLLAVLRGERPESTARLVDGALTVVQLLRALLPASPEQAPAQRSPSPQPPATPDEQPSQDISASGPAENPGLLRIDIR
ncbi:MAG TPA: hypothetical protein VFM01_13365 [Nakamurella sp.]|nr:hypothetical protein [Nakamurella sp.]